MNRFVVFFLPLFIFLASCEEEAPVGNEPLDEMSEVPAIVSAVLVKENNGYWLELVIEDGDGNIGTEDPDKEVVLVKDGRDSTIAVSYPLPPLSPNSERLAIRAEVEVELIQPSTEIANSNQWFCRVQVVDRSANWSNTVTTNTLTLP